MPTLRCLMALLCGVAAAAAGCVSDRTTDSGTPPASGCSLPLDEDVVGATQAIVAIRGFAFEPAQVTIPVGARVTWVNCEPDGTPSHTSTADDGEWGSSLLEPGDVFQFVFSEAGEYRYYCEPHPGMQAGVVVQ
jgi:plastocyanin